MENVNIAKSIKEEPFEEFLFPETIMHSAGFNLAENCCFLCEEGKEILISLKEHFQSQHPEILRDQLTDFCSCFDCLKLQTNLINHLLSHMTLAAPKVEETELDAIKEDVSGSEEFSESIEHDLAVGQKKAKTREKKPQIHRETKHKPFVCDICFKSFLYKQGLHKHYINEHNLVNESSYNQKRSEDQETALKVSCELCPKTFKYKQGLMKHFDLEHKPENTFPCTKCNSRCKTLKNLHSHLRTHEPPRKENLSSLQCAKCLKMFPSPKQLSLHLYTHREKFFTCDRCGAKFNNREQVKNHVLRHAGLFNKKASHQRIICDQCSTMVYSYKMKRHKLIHHSDQKPFKCDIAGCSASFSDKRILLDHQNIHLKLKPYKCEHCPEAFRSGANLRLHRLRHTDPDRFRCNECQTNFVTKQALMKHNRRHTEDPDIRPYACDYQGCNSTFKQKDHVRIHVRRTHEKTDDVFSCEFCSKSYNRKDALGKHLRKTHNITKRKTRVFPLTIV